MSDAIFAEPRLAEVYDAFDGSRDDLDLYLTLADEWSATLRSARTALRPGGRLVFERRRPERQAWRDRQHERSLAHAVVPGIGAVTTWVEFTEAREPLVSFRWTFVFEADGAVLTAHSTLRFRTRRQLTDSARSAGLVIEDVRDAPDRPGAEYVVLSRRPD
jgi:hypothetical protein